MSIKTVLITAAIAFGVVWATNNVGFLKRISGS